MMSGVDIIQADQIRTMLSQVAERHASIDLVSIVGRNETTTMLFKYVGVFVSVDITSSGVSKGTVYAPPTDIYYQNPSRNLMGFWRAVSLSMMEILIEKDTGVRAVVS